MFEQATATFDRRHQSFFAAGDEPCQIWALDTQRDRVVHLPDGAVTDAVRLACREGRLRCPVAGCPDPRLIAKGGTQRRHHFAHKVAHTPHDSAAVHRTEAVAMLAAWARRYRGAHISTSDDDALGIVTVRSQRSGRLVELAVTYDPRHEPVRTPVSPTRQLLLGHTRSMLLPRLEHPDIAGAWLCGDARLTRELIHKHGAAIAVNPQHQLVGTLIDTRIARHADLIPNDTAAHPTICIAEHIRTCRLDADGNLTTPVLRALRAWQAEHPDAPHGRPPRRPRPPSTTAATPSRPAEDIDLPVLADHEFRPRTPDINRVILSGRILDDPQRDHRGHGDGQMRLRIALNAAPPHRHVNIQIACGLPTQPSSGDLAVVHGRLSANRANGDLAIVADTLELYHHAN